MSLRRVPDWLVERAAAGDLPADRLAAVRAEIAADPDARVRDAALAASDADLMAELPAAAVAAEVARRAAAAARTEAAVAEQRSSRPWRVAGPLAGLALAGALALVVLPRLRGGAGGALVDETGAPAEDVTRVKGAPHLLVYRKRGDQVARLEGMGAAARAGDRLQLAYVAAGAEYGAVVSIDGAGVVTLHFPDSVHGSTKLTGGRSAPLGHSYQLDAAPGYERFFFVTSAEPIDVLALLAAARLFARDADHARRDPLPLSPFHEQWSLLVRKGDAP